MVERFKNIVLLIAVLSLFSCGGSNNEHFEIIRKSTKGQLREVSIGMTSQQVQSKENPAYLKNKKSDYLHYDYPISMGNSYTVAYDFSEDDKLYEVELTVFFDAIEDAQTLFLDFEEQFNQKYGKSKMADDGFSIWNINSEHQRVEIAMINDSQAYGYLSIILRDLDY